MTTYYDWVGEKFIPLTERKCTFDLAPGDTFRCFDQAEDTKGETYLDVKGNWKYLLMYYYCTDPSKNCHTPTETEEYLDGRADATLMFEDLLIDPFDFENPITTTTSFAIQPIKLSVGTTLVIELNEVEFISDNGWLFEDKKIITRFKPTVTKEISKTSMLSLQLKYGGTKTVYKRSYPKIQDFLAQVSGFITIITPIFFIFVAPYVNLQAIQHMTNEIYEIKLNKPNTDGDSPQKPSAKKRLSSKSKGSPVSPTGTERSLLQEKQPVKRAPSTPKNVPFSPHAALVIGGVGVKKPPVKEVDQVVPDENTTPVRIKALEKRPSSPFETTPSRTPNEDLSPQRLLSPEEPKLEKAKLLSPEDMKLEDEKLNENLEPAKENVAGDQSPGEGALDCEEEEEDVPLRSSDPLEVPWQSWLKSFWKPNPEVQVLEKAKEHLMEAFDLVTLTKKVIEIDKLKSCLFTHDQRVIFENLPSSVIVLNPDIDIKSPEAIKQYHWKDSFKGDEVAVRKAYTRLKGTKNELDKLLIRLYEDEFIDDGACL